MEWQLQKCRVEAGEDDEQLAALNGGSEALTEVNQLLPKKRGRRP
jgi:hypothetical protein